MKYNVKIGEQTSMYDSVVIIHGMSEGEMRVLFRLLTKYDVHCSASPYIEAEEDEEE